MAAPGEKGFEYWDVEGVPVKVDILPNGDRVALAYDSTPPRPFSFASLSRNGTQVDLVTFERERIRALSGS